ncbi:MAG: hypothetical protein GY730_02695 [bacterium]|nr:hypothetical protein [bacterium]
MKMKNTRILLLIFKSAICYIALLYNINSSIFASYNFLYNKFGTRALGMGGAYTALSEGPEAVFYNFATKPALDNFYATIENGSRLGEPFYALSAQNIFNISNLRFGYIYKSENDISKTFLNNFNQPASTGESFTFSINSIYLGWQTSLAGIDCGILGNYFQESLYNETGHCFNLGFAAHQYLTPNKDVSWGIAAKNILNSGVKWSTGHTDKISPVYVSGLNLKLFDRAVNICVDLEHENNRPARFFSGIEYWLSGSREYDSAFVIRTGLRQQDFTTGIGLYMKGIMFDYAYILPGEAHRELEHRFSIGWSLHNFKTKAEKQLSIHSEISKAVGTYNHFNFSKKIELSDKRTKARQKEKEQIVPRLLTLAKIKLEKDNTVTLTFESMAARSVLYINNKLIYKDNPNQKTVSLCHKDTMPINIRFYTRNQSKAIFIDIEKTKSGHLTLSGIIPEAYQAMIDESIITPRANGLFYKKILKETLAKNRNKAEMLIFSQNKQ